MFWCLPGSWAWSSVVRRVATGKVLECLPGGHCLHWSGDLHAALCEFGFPTLWLGSFVKSCGFGIGARGSKDKGDDPAPRHGAGAHGTGFGAADEFESSAVVAEIPAAERCLGERNGDDFGMGAGEVAGEDKIDPGRDPAVLVQVPDPGGKRASVAAHVFQRQFADQGHPTNGRGYGRLREVCLPPWGQPGREFKAGRRREIVVGRHGVDRERLITVHRSQSLPRIAMCVFVA